MATKKVVAKKDEDRVIYFVSDMNNDAHEMCVGMIEAARHVQYLVADCDVDVTDIEVYRCDKKMYVEINCLIKEEE